MTTGKTIALTMQIWKDCFTTASLFTWILFLQNCPWLGLCHHSYQTQILLETCCMTVYMLQHTHTLSYFLKKNPLIPITFLRKIICFQSFYSHPSCQWWVQEWKYRNQYNERRCSWKRLIGLRRNTKAPLSLFRCIISCMIPGTAAAQGSSWHEKEGMKGFQ